MVFGAESKRSLAFKALDGFILKIHWMTSSHNK